jgi:MEDS: MEthanogen/methylotroph, DcmR Sensory domain
MSHRKRNAPLRPESSPAHVVQFYDPQRFPAEKIADYFLDGLRDDEGAVMIATPDHIEMVRANLKLHGVDGLALERAGLWFSLDAIEVLDMLRDDYPVSDQTCDAILGFFLAHAKKLSPSGRLRVFGEIVDVCAKTGDFATCVQIEQQWDRLAGNFALRIYCAYSVECFAGEQPVELTSEIDALHEENAPLIPAPHINSWLGILLQQSCALHVELQSREAFEAKLQRCEGEYAQLFDTHIELWRQSIAQGLPGIALRKSQPADLDDDLDRMLERVLDGILNYCGEAGETRLTSAAGSADFNKSTGRILAYGKLTSALHKLQIYVQTRGGVAVDPFLHGGSGRSS